MVKAKPSPGICPTCNNVETCASRPGYRPPVFYCEQFDNSSKAAVDTMVMSTTGPEEKNNMTMGLCCNCDNRISCASSRTPGGIWHCEEYA